MSSRVQTTSMKTLTLRKASFVLFCLCIILFSFENMTKGLCHSFVINETSTLKYFLAYRLFLEKKEAELSEFVFVFKSASAADEKIALMERFLGELW